MRAAVVIFAAVAGWFSAVAAAAPIWQLGISIRESGEPAAARVLVRDANGRSFQPPVAVTENVGRDTWFACDGRTRLDLPEGKYVVRVERGPEYRPILTTVDLAQSTSREFALVRWIDMTARGYRCGENHLHVPAPTLPALMRAEGLDFGSSLFWWNGPYFPPPIASAEHSARVTLVDSEVENDWGAVYLVGLRQPMPLAWDAARPNLAYLRAARELGALNCYQGGWSREALLDALLGYVDVVNIGDNLFHRHKFMPRERYMNLLGVAGLPTFPATADGMLELATTSYYRLLNCGLHLAAGAGTAAGVKSSPAGYNRAYVKVAAGASVSEFLEAWRRGRNFVTNGPMLFLTVDDRYEPGDTVELPADGTMLHLRAEAVSDQPLRSVAIVVNGVVVARGSGGVVAGDFKVEQGSWIAAVATAEDESVDDAELARYRQESRLGGESPTRLLFAHTSPVYVTVAGRGAKVAASVAEARRLLDQFDLFARQSAAPAYQAEILEAIAAARRRL